MEKKKWSWESEFFVFHTCVLVAGERRFIFPLLGSVAAYANKWKTKLYLMSFPSSCLPPGITLSNNTFEVVLLMNQEAEQAICTFIWFLGVFFACRDGCWDVRMCRQERKPWLIKWDISKLLSCFPLKWLGCNF